MRKVSRHGRTSTVLSTLSNEKDTLSRQPTSPASRYC